MFINILGLGVVMYNSAMPLGTILPSCIESKPGLFGAAVAHTVVLIIFSLFLSLCFYGIGRMLRELMHRGLLRTSGAAAEGAFEHNTVSVPEIDENNCECPICLEGMQHETAVMTKGCHHIFHKACLQNWMQVNATCPLCRSYLGSTVGV